jgi:hypothetical protein
VIVRRVAWAASGLALAAAAVQYAFYAVAAIRFPFGLDYSEGLIWQQALWLGTAHLYGDIARFPFLVCEYPPLYLVALRGVALSGIGMLQAGRGISVASTLVACALLGFLVRRMCRVSCGPAAASAAGVIAGLLPLTLLPVLSWSVLMRVDMLALALTLAGIFCACVSFRRPAAIYAAVGFFVAAAFTKQIYVAGAVAMFFVCLVRSPGSTLRAYAGGAVVGLALLGGLEWATQGRFLRHILVYTADTVDPSAALRQTALWVGAYPVYAGLTVTACVLFWRHFLGLGRGGVRGLVRDREDGAWLVFLTLYLLLTSVMLVAAGKTGASRNYFIEWMCCWCLWIGWLAGLVLSRRDGRGTLAVLIPALILLQLLPVTLGMSGMRAEQFSAQRRADWGALLARVRGIKGPLLSDDMVLTIESGREVGLEPGVLLELARLGVWDERRLTERLRAHYFAAVITAYDPGDPTFDARYLPATQAALLAAYPRVERYGDYRLRLP